MWKRKRLNVPIEGEELNGIIPVITSLGNQLADVLSLTSDSLNIIKLFLIDNGNSISSQLLLLFEVIVDSTLNSNYSACFVIPTIENQHTTEVALDLLANSVVDVYDDNRPIVGNSQDVLMFLVAIESGTYTGLIDIINLFSNLFTVETLNFEVDNVVKPGEALSPEIGQAEYPDWNSARIKNISPVISKLANGFQDMLDIFGNNVSSGNSLIDSAINIIDKKLLILSELINSIEILVESYLSILNIGDVLVYKIEGSYTSIELQGQILLAKEELERLRVGRQEYFESIQIDNPEVSASLITEINKPTESDNVGAIFAFSFNSTNTEIGEQIFGG